MSLRASRTKRTSLYIRTVAIAVGVLFVGALTAGQDQALAASGINNQINYQGKLLTATGIPVASGTYSIAFSLYDAESGGNRIWTASGDVTSPSAITVTVANEGLFSILLGSGAQNSLDSVDWNSDSIYLGVTVGSDSEMTPRKRFGAVAQAFNAERWDGYKTATSVQSGEHVLKLSQTSADAATSDRSTLVLTTSGTSDVYDYLLKLQNASGDVFTVSRQGNTTTTGNLAVLGQTILGTASSDTVVLNSSIASDILPDANGIRDIGSPLYSWQNIYASGTESVLRGINFTYATGTSATTTHLFTTYGQATNFIATNATTTNLSFVYATGTGSIALQTPSTARYSSLIRSGDTLTLSNQVVQVGDLDTWTQRDSSRNWYDVAMSSDGSVQTAVVYDGDIYTSSDYGETWTARGYTRSWIEVAVSSDGTKQAGTSQGFNGYIYLSTDSGVTWTATSTEQNWRGVDMSSDGSVIVAGTSGGQLYLSTDSGATWTATGTSAGWSDVAVSADGSVISATVSGGQIYVSTDTGATWTARETSRSWGGIDMSSDGVNQVAAAQSGGIYLSTNSGETWSISSAPSEQWNQVAMSSDGTMITAAPDWSGQLYTSTDSGSSWTAREEERNWGGVAMSSDGSRQTAVAMSGHYIYTNVNSNTTVAAPVFVSQNSTLPSEIGILTVGYGYGRTVLNGATLRFQTGGTEYARITSAGYFGIGTDTPNDVLTVAGNVTPSSTNAYDLGSPTYSWKDIYASGTNSILAGINFTYATGTSATTTNFFTTYGQATNFTITNFTYTNATATNLYISGNFSAGSSTITTLDFTHATGSSLFVTSLRTGGDILPATNNVYDIGSPLYSWRNFYASGTAAIQTLNVSGTSTFSSRVDADYIDRWYLNPKLTYSQYGVRTTSTIGGFPSDMAFDGSHLWIANFSSYVQKLDVLTGQVVATTTVGSMSRSVVFDGSHIWVANVGSHNVSKIDIHTSQVVATVPVGSGPMATAFDGSYVWVVNQTDENVSKIDITTDAVVATTTVGGTPNAIEFDGRYMWVSNSGDDTISKIDVNTDTVVKTIPAPGDLVQDFAFDGQYMWFVEGTDDALYKLDVFTNLIVSTTTIGNSPNGILYDGKFIWVTHNYNGGLEKYDAQTKALLQTYHFNGIAATAEFDGNYIWVGDYAGHITRIMADGTMNGAFMLRTDLGVDVNDSFDIGTALYSWRNVYASGTAYVGTDVVVNGQSVCLEDGTNCAATPYLTTATTTVGEFPGYIAFDGNYMWVSNFLDDTVSKINIATNDVVATVTVGTEPYGVAFDGTYIWVANTGSDNVSKIDIDTNTVVATVIVGDEPWGVAFDGSYIWAANFSSDNVSKIDINENSVVATTTVGSMPFGMAFDGSHMWTTNYGDSTVSKINTTTNGVDATVAVGSGPWGVAFDGTAIWVANFDEATMSKINVSTDSVIATVPTGSGPSNVALGGGYIWVTNYDDNNVTKIDITTNTVVATATAGTNPDGIATDDTYMWVVNQGSNNVTKISILGLENAYMLHADLLPSVTDTYDIGSPTLSWQDIYASGTIHGVAAQFSSSTNAILVGSGTLANPAFSFSSSPDSGMYTGGTDVRFAVDAATKFIFGTSWNTSYQGLRPISNNAYDLGAYGNAWQDIYASGTIYGSEMVMTGTSTFSGGIVTGAYQFTEDAGFVPAMDMSVSDAPTTGDQMSYAFKIDGVSFLKMYSEADGSGSIQNTEIRAYQNLVPSQTNSIDLGSPSRSFQNIYASGTNSILRGLNFTYATGTSATTTNFFTTYGEATNFITTNLTYTNATATNLYISGNFSAGSSTVTTLDFTNATGSSLFVTSLRTGGNILPLSNNAYDIGAMNLAWKDIYASGTIYGTEMTMSGTSTFLGGIVTGAYRFTEDAGFVSAMDMSVSDAPDAGTQMSYTFNIDGTPFLKMYSEADSAGGIQNEEIRAFQNLVPSQTNSIDLGSPSRSFQNIYASGTIFTDNASAYHAITTEFRATNALGEYITSVAGLATSAQKTLKVQGRYAYIIGGDNLLYVLDITDPYNPSLESNISITTGGADQDLQVRGRYAYILHDGSDRLSAVDILDPSNPVDLGYVGVSVDVSTNSKLEVDGRYAYVIGNGGDEMAIIDISDPSNMAVVSAPAYSWGATANPRSIVVRDGFAYVLNYGDDSLNILDVSDPMSVTLVGSSTHYGVFDMAIEGNRAYLVGNNSPYTLYEVDVTSSTNPTEVSTQSLSAGVRGIVASGKRVYVFNSSADGYAFDYTSSTNVIVSRFDNAHTLNDTIDIQGRFLYAWDDTNDDWHVFEPPIIESHAAYVGTAEIGDLMVSDRALIDGDLTVTDSFTVEGSAFIHGSMAIEAYGTSTAQAFRVNNRECGGESDGYLATFTDETNVLVSIRCDGSVHADAAYSSAGGDYAEYFLAEGTLPTTGDVVALSGDSSSTVMLGSADARSRTIGVVSDRPAVIGRAELESATSSVIVGLMGQLEVKVDAASSSIAIGDELMMGANGYAVKAKGPGMIIGTALESLGSGTGTVMTYVSPGWWAGDLLAVDASGNARLISDLEIASSMTASTSTSLVSSPLFSFTGTAYNEASSTVISSTFHLLNDVVSTTTARFTISSDATSTSLLTVSEIGDVAIAGKFYPSDTGNIQYNRYIYYDGSDGAGGDRMRTNAAGWGTGSYDFAEMFPSHENLEPGDIVVVDPSDPAHVKRSTSPYEGAVVGIVSTQPGFLAGDNGEGEFPIALSGRVPTKVTTENGTITAGDYLAASSEPGRAMKATDAGPTVGIALEDYDGMSASTTIIAYVYVGWFGGEEGSESGTQGAGFAQQGFAKIAAGDKQVHVQHESVGSYPMIVATPYGLAGSWWIANQSDTGFTIIIESEQTADVIFTWFVTGTPAGMTMWNSDNTSNAVDPLTGDPIPLSPDPP